jgi:hypothetical protein
LVPLTLGGLAIGLGEIGLRSVGNVFAMTALIAAPLWLFSRLSLDGWSNDLLFYSLVGGALLLNSFTYALVGLLHRRIVSWPSPQKTAALVLAVAGCGGISYLVALCLNQWRDVV